MYESHFGLTNKPFQLTPDAAFLFPSKGHKRAASYLQYGLHKGEGFIVISGDVGTGKTTLVCSLLEQIDNRAIRTAHIVSTQLDSYQLLREAATQFGIATEGLDKAGLLSRLREFSADLSNNEQRALLIIDEAQNLGVDAIEEIRMLSNFAVGNQSSIQVFLIGQPRLRQVMASPEMGQIRQRTAAQYHLGPMDEEDTAAYIEHRLSCAGSANQSLFSEQALSRIFEYSGGIARCINTVCERALMAAYLNEDSDVSVDTVNEVIAELDAQSGAATSGATAISTHTGGLISAIQGSQLPAVNGAGVRSDALRDIDQRITALEASNVLVVQTLRRLLGEIDRYSERTE